jgi:hypothetical protein
MRGWFATVEKPSRQASRDLRRIPADDNGSFDINDDFFDEDGGFDEDGFTAWSEHLQSEFVKSPEFKNLPDGDYGFIDCVLNYAVRYTGEMPTTMSVLDLEEILFGVVPRKVMAESEDAECIVLELNAFFRFIEREYAIAHARKLAAALNNKAAKRLKKELGDQSNFGMAKSFFGISKSSGFDMSTQEGLDRATLAWNANLPKLTDGPEFNDHPISHPALLTIRRDSPRIGRHVPCHCGSGKKYKKCCLQKDG